MLVPFVFGIVSFLASFTLFTHLTPKDIKHPGVSVLAETSRAQTTVTPTPNPDNSDETSILGEEIILFPTEDPTPKSKSITSPTPKPSPTLSVATQIETSTVTPTPKSSPTLQPFPSPTLVTLTQMEEWFTYYSNKESVSRDLLKKIAVCESGLNPNAENGIYGGLYQFSTSAWASARRAMNASTDATLRFQAEEAIKTAAFKIATGGAGIWPNCIL